MKRLLMGLALLTALTGAFFTVSSLMRSGAGAQTGYFGGAFNQAPVGYYGGYDMRPYSPIFNSNANVVWYPYVMPSQPWYDQYVTGATGRFAVSRTSDSIDVIRDKDGLMQVKWQGEPRAVQSISVSFLDKDHKKLLEQSVTRLPVDAKAKPPEKTAYYRFAIEYVDGSITSVTSPFEALPEPVPDKAGPTPPPIKE